MQLNTNNNVIRQKQKKICRYSIFYIEKFMNINVIK